jgi:hypothetical protein
MGVAFDGFFWCHQHGPDIGKWQKAAVGGWGLKGGEERLCVGRVSSQSLSTSLCSLSSETSQAADGPRRRVDMPFLDECACVCVRVCACNMYTP